MNRRNFLSGMALLCTPLSARTAPRPDAAAATLDAWLAETVATSRALRRPGQTGALDAALAGVLFGFFSHIGDRWEFPADSAKRRALFNGLVSVKTSVAPSYLFEYNEAALVIERLLDAYNGAAYAYDRLLEADVEDSACVSRVARVRTFASIEFIRWFMAKDGFARFGYQNYRGLMAGSFTLSPPPYRPL